MAKSGTITKDAITGNKVHYLYSANTPLREDAFNLNEEEKIKIITEHFREIMKTMGLDLEDDSLKGTPARVAKMFIKEAFRGLNPANKPDMKLFDNTYKYNEMLVEKNITVHSYCEHHFVPIVGRAHVGYISNGKVIGLSKINRLVQYYSKRPQVQERLNMQIGLGLQEALGTKDVAVMIDAVHLCVLSRGVNDTNSNTITTYFSGRFKEDKCKKEFLDFVRI